MTHNDDAGRLVPNATLFPNGLKHLGEQLKAMGLKFGLYTDISGHSCSFNPDIGSMGKSDNSAPPTSTTTTTTHTLFDFLVT